MNRTFARRLVIILLIPYCLFLFEFITQDVSIRNIVKVVASVVAPIPIAVFLAYIFTTQETLIGEIDQATISTIASFAYLSNAILLSIMVFYGLETFIYQNLTQTVAPIFFNSFILMAYIINIIYIRNMQMIAILSGASIGISSYVLFLT
jgi:hypothetical protein